MMTTSGARPGQVTTLSFVIDILKTFRDLKPANATPEQGDIPMTLQQCELLLWISMRPGITVREICDLTGLAQSSASRNIAALGLWHRKGVPGLDLVTTEKDPAEARREIIFLSPRGRQVVAGLIAKVDPTIQFEAPSFREYTTRRPRGGMVPA